HPRLDETLLNDLSGLADGAGGVEEGPEGVRYVVLSGSLVVINLAVRRSLRGVVAYLPGLINRVGGELVALVGLRVVALAGVGYRRERYVGRRVGVVRVARNGDYSRIAVDQRVVAYLHLAAD